MKTDYLELGDKRYRIEFNWNTIAAWMDNTGHAFEDLGDMKSVKGSDLTELFYQSVVEGSRMDGVEFPLSKLDFGAMLNPRKVADLLIIYARHMQSMTSVVGSKKK